MTAESSTNAAADIIKKTVREQVDAVVDRNLEFICQSIRMETKRIAGTNQRGLKIIQETDRIVRILEETGDKFHAIALFRYLIEGNENSYHVDVAPFLQMLQESEYMDGPDCGLLDLGCGPGTLVDAWKATGRPARGIDLSPSFVAKHSDLRLGLIDDDHMQLLDAIGEFKPGLVLTSMTLDRVRNPGELLANVTNIARRHRAPFVIATILPIVPKDDDTTDKPLVYTDPDLTLTRGDNVSEDKQTILNALEVLADDYDIEIKTVHYVIDSSSGQQHTYLQYCFMGKPREH